MNTVLITGCSSGFGLETARYFLDRGWTVVATMRAPQDCLLPPSERLRVVALDVTDPESIRRAIEAAGPIDVLVNNAGVGLVNALEGVSMKTIRDVFDANTFGTFALTQAVLPQFRERQSGVIVNVTSSLTLLPQPLVSVYTASKAAVNAFSESLALELETFGIRVRVVIPGFAPHTAFSRNARALAESEIPVLYEAQAQAAYARWRQETRITHAEDVAEAIWRAATDPSSSIRLPAGADAVAWMSDS